MYAISPFPGHKVVKVHQLGVPFQRWYSICSYGENGPLWHLRCKVIFRNHSNLGSYTYIWFVSSTTVNTIKYLVHGESFSILYHENLSLRHSLITFCSSPELNTLVLEFPASFFFFCSRAILALNQKCQYKTRDPWVTSLTWTLSSIIISPWKRAWPFI